MNQTRVAALAFAFAALLIAPGAGAMDSGGDSSRYAAPAAKVGDSSDMTRARAAIAAKDYAGAIKILYPLSQAMPKDADVENLLGFSYRMMGQYPQAFFYYDKALAIDPAHRGALEYEGEAYLETHQLPKAEATLATLKRACGSAGCPEVADLDAAIAKYKKRAAVN